MTLLPFVDECQSRRRRPVKRGSRRWSAAEDVATEAASASEMRRDRVAARTLSRRSIGTVEARAWAQRRGEVCPAHAGAGMPFVMTPNGDVS